MVSLKVVQESNATIRTTIGPGQVSLFVGATSGIALTTMLEYAKKSASPRIYIVGRGEAKLSGVVQDLEDLNPQGTYIPIRSEISLLKNVDAACNEFQKKEKSLDLLVMCPGYLKLTRRDNADGLEDTVSLRYYVRARFIQNLLPQLTTPKASRIVSIHGAGNEGKMIEDDLELKHNFSLINGAVHTATMNSLALREISKNHPSISCIHVFPGVVITPSWNRIGEEWIFPLRVFWNYVFLPVTRTLTVSLSESGQRHLFHSTSARYPPASTKDSPDAGVALPGGLQMAEGVDGKPGSGCYLLDQNGEKIGKQKVMDEYEERDMGKKIWEHTQEIFDRVLQNNE